MPCILVASETQRETEQEYYRDVVGFCGEFLYAENLKEARLMVIGRKGFLPVEGTGQGGIGGNVYHPHSTGPGRRTYLA